MQTFRVEIKNCYQATMFILTNIKSNQVINLIQGFSGEELTFIIQDQKTLKQYSINDIYDISFIEFKIQLVNHGAIF